jgi:surface antigen
MMRRTTTLGAMALLVTMTAGCADVGTKTMVGGLGGAAAGGLIGAAAGGGGAGIAAGVLLGGLLGGAAGNYLDQRDKQLAAKAAHSALETTPSGTTTAWKNPDNGHSGAVTPKRTYQTASGQYCREYTQAITVGGRKQTSYGTACRQPDGQWKIVS